MRRNGRATCCLFVLCTLPLLAQQARQFGDDNATVIKEVLQAEKALLNTYVTGDVTARERYAADEFVVVDYDGGVTTKQEDIQDIKNGTFIMKGFRMKNEKVAILSADVALLTYEIAYEATDHGTDASSPHSRVAAVYRRQDGTWRCVYTQEAKVKEVQATADSAATGSPKLEPDSFFVEKEKEVWQALEHKDKAAAIRVLADDFVGMYDFGFFNKSEWVEQIDDQYTVDHYAVLEPRVLRPSPTTALLLYTSTCKGTGAWADYCSHTSRISDLWVERNGQWLDLFSQDTTATSSEQGSSLSAQALEKEREIQEAQKQGDWARFADLLSDDLVAIDEDGIRSKKELLEEIRTSDFHLSDYKMEDVRTIPEGNGAIVAYKQTHIGTEHGKPFALHIYTHSNWQRRGDKWVLTMFQDSTAK